ncbi:MAG: hypothetical protein ACE5D4_01665 [Thermodesulfobacteriota bacterium]
MNYVNSTYPAMHIPVSGGFASTRQRVVSAVREVVSERAYIALEYRDGVWEADRTQVSSFSTASTLYASQAGLYGSNGEYVVGSVRKAQLIDIYL